MQEEFTLEEACDTGVVICESTGEYTLPDYMPEVRRVLRLDADTSVSGQYENGDKTSVGGETRYRLVYTDADGNMASAPLEGTFEGSIPLPQGAPMMVWSRPENVTCRLGGPRRISLKTGVSLHPHAYRRIGFQAPGVPEVAGKTELLHHPMSVATTEFFHAGDIALTDSVKAEEGSEVLTYDGQVLIRQVKCETDEVCVRGEVWLTALCNNTAKKPYTTGCKIPFEETLHCDGVTPEFTGIARANCHLLSCEITEGTGGCNLIFDVSLNIDGMAAKNTVVEVVTDLYATAYEMKPKSERARGRCYPLLQMANFTVDGGARYEDLGCADTLQPVDARAQVVSSVCTADGAGVLVEGEVRVSCILACEPEDGGYRSECFTMPYKVRVACGEPLPYGTELSCDVTCVSCRVRRDGAKIGADVELGILLIGCLYETADIITSAEPDADAPVPVREGEIIAAYLADGDSLWSVGKRYHVPLSEMVFANSLPDEALDTPDFPQHLDGLTRLMII